MNRPSASQIDRKALAASVLELQRRIVLLRYKTPEGRSREECLRYLEGQIEALKDRCDLPGGWTDPDDPFAEMAVSLLRWEFAELTRPGREYPVPEEDPRPRTGSGHIIEPGVRVIWTNTLMDKEEQKQVKFRAGNKRSKDELTS